MSAIPHNHDPSENDPIVWVTRDGQQMTMAEIGDRHLGNIIRLLHRRIAQNLSEGYSALCFFQGEFAQMEVEHQIEQSDHNLRTKLRIFEREAKHRGLKI